MRLNGFCRHSSWARCSRSSWAGPWFIALALILCLPSSPASAQNSQPTSPLGPTDYATFQADLLIVRQRYESYETALRLARDANASISEELKSAREELRNYRDGSTKYFPELLTKVATLEKQLAESNSLVAGLRQSLESAQAEYDLKLGQAQKRAQALERENRRLKIGLGVAGAAAFGLGIWAAVK